MKELSCFKTYDIRGEINVNINTEIAYRVGRATGQHFNAKSVVIGFDARETSPEFASCVAKGIQDSGSNVINIGLAGTEEMYWAVSQFGACAGIEVTASHNPINYNGMKIVKSNSQPLHEEIDFKAIKRLAEADKNPSTKLRGVIVDKSIEARDAYVDRVLSFTDIRAFKPLKIVVNSGNGAAGPTFDAIAHKLSMANVPLEFIRINHAPDSTFPNGIPNPLLTQNHYVTASTVKEVGADFGIAFDGDFDRCFLFDEDGMFVKGEYVVGFLASVFLEKEPGSRIVHDPRVIWNTKDVIKGMGGIAVQSKTGHAFIKRTMRDHQAVYGGEMSAHHYFRDFAYCDSGMIPWLLVAEKISKSGQSLKDQVRERFDAFPSSGEINFRVKDAETSIQRVVEAFSGEALSLDDRDGLSLSFKNWRFNLRRSNTEPLVRLNIESRGRDFLKEKVNSITDLLDGVRISG
ncbi:MAG: phosphomannomutase [Candidatus Endolissoclinum sp. TMED37]|nr:MAG: phosphomannomutase [Candidatus Endolissoclinum sp. TMED37]|tara:strand:+ start:658 stop:2040 length:1383 start_codon:yes stop_codon:yes gene_type:complete